MFQNKRVMGCFKKIFEENLKCCQRIKNYDIENQRPRSDAGEQDVDNKRANPEEVACDENLMQLWKIPTSLTSFGIFWYFFTWPIRLILNYTIPDPEKHKRLILVSFIMCIIWIGCSSYMIFWMIVIVGDTFGVNESILGLTFVAFGGCMPEAIAAVIVARKGSGEMGVSNALGANCLAILFSLGIPWFIKTMVNGAGWTDSKIVIYSYGMEYTILILILAILTLYIVLSYHGYKLRLKVGIYLCIFYTLFIIFAILMEYNVFLVGAPAEC